MLMEKTLKIIDDQNVISSIQLVHWKEFGIDGGILQIQIFKKLHL